jgi:hypothetical protein
MLEDKIEQLEHTRDLYLRDLEPENLAIIRKSFGLQVMCKRRDWLKKQVKRCDEEIGGLREQEGFND